MLTIALTLLGCYIGSGESASEIRDITGFTSVSLTSSFDAEVSVDDQQRVEVTCDSNLLDHIETELRGDTLWLGTPQMTGVSPKADCYVRITGPSFTAFETSGSGDLYAEGPLVGLSEVLSSGSGDQLIRGVDSDDLYLSTSGSGGIFADGAAATLAVKTSGSGDVDARDIDAQDADVRSSGSGDVSVTVYGHLDARLSGSGDLDVYGDPQSVDQDTTGSGDIQLH